MPDLRPTAPEVPSRRRLFGILLSGGGAAVTALLGPALGRLGIAPLLLRGSEKPSCVDIGRASDFADTASGQAGPREVVVQHRVVDGYMERIRKCRVTVVRDPASPCGLSALSTTCTHLGCGVSWDAEKKVFVCPCHGGAYAPDGSVLSGPPPRPLERLEVSLDGGRLRVVPERQA